jgi:hypothetical protein
MHNSNSNNRPETLQATPAEPSGLGARLLELTSQIADLFGTLDLQSLPADVFAADAFHFMGGLREILHTPEGESAEPAHVGRKAALFIVEGLSRSLRRDLDPRDVPQEQAQLLDAMFSKVQAAQTGVAGTTADLRRLDELEKDSAEFMQEAAEKQRLTLKVPLAK